MKKNRDKTGRNDWIQAVRRHAAIALCCLLATAASAQMPHRIAVLVNAGSQESKKAANVFAALHGVPGSNLIYLEVPQSMVSGRAECTPEEFLTQIYQPAIEQLAKRGLSRQVHAWVYSVDFPIRVLTSENDRRQMSLMGMTFTRGMLPDLDLVEKGQLISPLFAGPSLQGGPQAPSRSFDVFHAQLKDKMPLPSMMLGYIGENGTCMDTVLRTIESGMRARQRGPESSILFLQTDDKPRSEPREWQYAAVQSELAILRRQAVIATNRPPVQTGAWIGVMTGAETVRPGSFGTFAPGAMAEHMTSWSADFQRPQSKCTEWLKAGATVTAGMVTEPYNAWTKFPHARFFVHYASGCSAMESFYQSIASPFQVLLLGNPLSQIVGLPVEIQARGLSREITKRLDAAFIADASFPVNARVIYSALLNGREIKPPDANTLIELPFDEMGDGYHEVRVIAQALAPVSPGGFRDIPVFINRTGRSVSVLDIQDAPQPGHIAVSVAAQGEEPPQEMALLWNGQELAREPYAEGVTLVFNEDRLGEGPHRIQAIGIYPDGMRVRSEPRAFGIVFNPERRAGRPPAGQD